MGWILYPDEYSEPTLLQALWWVLAKSIEIVLWLAAIVFLITQLF